MHVDLISPSLNKIEFAGELLMELWDAYNAGFEKIENTLLVRREKIPDGLFHLVCDILVKHTDGTYLLMQRNLKNIQSAQEEVTAPSNRRRG